MEDFPVQGAEPLTSMSEVQASAVGRTDSANLSTGAKPSLKFGDPVVNIYASENNPMKRGFFVRKGFSACRVNGGPWLEYTDGLGRFAKILGTDALELISSAL
jgi:hypothetical protein